MQNVLLVEDRIEMQMLVKKALSDLCILDVCSTGAEALTQIRQKEYSLIILDVILPDLDGFHIMGQLELPRGRTKPPVIFLTGKSDLSDRVLGFSLGADDYIVKPFDPIEFRARIGAKLNNLKARSMNTSEMQVGDFHIDLAKQKIQICRQGQAILKLDLTAHQFKLLSYFIQNEGSVLTRTQILEAVWDDSINVTDRTIDSHIYALRQKMKEWANCIISVYGEGYRFVSNPDRAAISA